MASFADQTVRMVVRRTIGGARFRVEFANIQQGEAVTFGAIRTAIAGLDGSTVAGTDRVVTFDGRAELTLPPGARAVSDPVELDLPPLTEVAISIYLPERTPANTVDPLALMAAYIVGGDQTAGTRPACHAHAWMARGLR